MPPVTVPQVSVRARTESDVLALVQVGRRTHLSDRYPWRDHVDLAAFLRGPAPALGAWAAELDGAVVGQVVLSEPEPAWVADGGLPGDVLAVSRLLVDPGARRVGAARALLHAASALANPRPVGLDVMLPSTATVEFYERLGWRRTGTGEFVLGDERVPRGYYLQPDDGPHPPGRSAP